MFIEIDNPDEAINRLSNIFGIHEIDICYFTEEKSTENICEIASTLVNVGDTFKVETNRSDKTFPINSMDLSKKVGAYILKNVNNIKVDVHTPRTIVKLLVMLMSPQAGETVYDPACGTGGMLIEAIRYISIIFSSFFFFLLFSFFSSFFFYFVFYISIIFAKS